VCAIASIVFALSACKTGSPNGPAGPVNQHVVLAPGATAAVPGGATIRFESVTADSRCPGDAICIWAGDAIVRVVVSSSGSAATYELHTVDLKPIQHRDLTIALETLTPYPFASLGPIKSGDYRATLRITR
jgi:hypothetical protein